MWRSGRILEGGLGADILPGREAPLPCTGHFSLPGRTTRHRRLRREGRVGAPPVRARPSLWCTGPDPHVRVVSSPRVIVKMKRRRTPPFLSGQEIPHPLQRQQLPPRLLFTTPPDETSAFTVKAEPRPVNEPLVTPRILPSILSPVSTAPSQFSLCVPARSQIEGRSRSQVQLDLYPDGGGTRGAFQTRHRASNADCRSILLPSRRRTCCLSLRLRLITLASGRRRHVATEEAV